MADDDVLETFPFDEQTTEKVASRNKRRKKPRKDSGAPVEEIDALGVSPTAEEQAELAEATEPVVAAAEPAAWESEAAEPVGHDFDALPSAPPQPSLTDWEQFLRGLPRHLLTLIYESGLFTKELLLAHSRKTLMMPIGRFSPF